MDNKRLYMELLKILKLKDIKCDEEMKNHTSLRVGGKVNFLVEPNTEKQLQQVINLLIENKITYYIIGRGSNLLVKDEGLSGVIIKISDKFKGIEKIGNKLIIKSGTPLAEVAKYAYKAELTGIEFASGIPGSIGGAIAMNAGAYGGEMKDIVSSVKIIDDKGCIKTLSCKEMNFSYRKSLITYNPLYTVISVEIELKSGNKYEIFEQMNVRALKRSSSQPLEKCNCGSTFKRPEGHFAGQLIEECGLKGFSLNGVEVSSKHAGFVVNNGKSTATDMLNMINLVKERVKDKFGITLEEEVKII